MLGGGHRVAHGGVDHGHAGPGGGVQVDVVHADAGARHYLEVAPGGDDGLGDAGFAADDQGVIIANGGDQFVRGKAALDVNGNPFPEQVNAFGGHIVGNQYFGHRAGASP